MPKFIITWNAGYGQSAAVIEANNIDDARSDAYGRWREEAESGADYGAQEYDADEAYALSAEDETDA